MKARSSSIVTGHRMPVTGRKAYAIIRHATLASLQCGAHEDGPKDPCFGGRVVIGFLLGRATGTIYTTKCGTLGGGT